VPHLVLGQPIALRKALSTSIALKWLSSAQTLNGLRRERALAVRTSMSNLQNEQLRRELKDVVLLYDFVHVVVVEEEEEIVIATTVHQSKDVVSFFVITKMMSNAEMIFDRKKHEFSSNETLLEDFIREMINK
jgi:hypothetical protein